MVAYLVFFGKNNHKLALTFSTLVECGNDIDLKYNLIIFEKNCFASENMGRKSIASLDFSFICYIVNLKLVKSRIMYNIQANATWSIVLINFIVILLENSSQKHQNKNTTFWVKHDYVRESV